MTNPDDLTPTRPDPEAQPRAPERPRYPMERGGNRPTPEEIARFTAEFAKRFRVGEQADQPEDDADG